MRILITLHLIHRSLTTTLVTTALLIAVSLFIITGNSFAQDNSGSRRLVLATGDFAPHITPDLANGGSYTQIIREAFSHSGYETEIQYFPWKRAWKEALELRADGSYSWSPKEERRKLFYFSTPIAQIERHLFTARNSTVYASTMPALAGKSLCRPLAYTLHGQLRVMADAGDIRVIRPEDMRACFQLAVRGRVDFIEADYFEALAAIVKAGHKIQDMRQLDIVASKNPNNLIVAKTHPRAREILSALNAGLKALRQSGRHAAILENSKTEFIDSLVPDKTN